MNFNHIKSLLSISSIGVYTLQIAEKDRQPNYKCYFQGLVLIARTIVQPLQVKM